MNNSIIATPVGKIIISAENESITRITFADDKITLHNSTDKILLAAVSQIDQYFSQKKNSFDLPLKLIGTDLQQKIWQRLKKIPFGETVTYGELAKELNTSARVIGNACRMNPILLVIPCHRVVAVNGLGGFSGKKSGQFLAIKKWLLEYEQ